MTARLPSSARPGQRIDVTVSSAGDAISLQGGVLQLTHCWLRTARHMLCFLKVHYL